MISDITDISYIDIISNRIIDEINRDFSYISKPSPVGVSIGISLFPQDAQDIDTMINNADEAMYKVKSSSKNGYALYKKETLFTS
ncbi:MAG: diguanylate cyclase [Sulfurimonas sp.]|nr:diguanylate cyclase [Sulfurimonas sp.]